MSDDRSSDIMDAGIGLADFEDVAEAPEADEEEDEA